MIDPSDLVLEEKVGSGGSGTVYKGQWKSRGITVAIKTSIGEINKEEVYDLILYSLFVFTFSS